MLSPGNLSSGFPNGRGVLPPRPDEASFPPQRDSFATRRHSALPRNQGKALRHFIIETALQSAEGELGQGTVPEAQWARTTTVGAAILGPSGFRHELPITAQA